MSTMDKSTKLLESTNKLSTMSTSLAVQRAAIHNHFINDSVSGPAKYIPFLSMKEKYLTEETEYRMELENFWDLLLSAEDCLKEHKSTPSVASVEIESNHSVMTSDTSPKADVQSIGYSQDETDEPSDQTEEVPEPAQAMKVRQSVDTSIAPPLQNTKSQPKPVPTAVAPKQRDISTSSTKEEFPALPGSKSTTINTTKTRSTSCTPPQFHVHTKAKVAISMGLKHSDKGFTLWNRNKGQRMYTTTELYCTKTFGTDIQKLRRYLVAKGGFKGEQIRSIRVFQVADRQTGNMVYHARIVVDGNMGDIQRGIDQIHRHRENNQNNRRVIWISTMKRNAPSNTLMVRNFDILTGNDRRKLTTLFSRFGPMDCAIKMGRDRDGINFAVMTFCRIEDARDCERTQNDGRQRKLCFNGRKLQIGYAAENGTRNGNGNKRQRWNKRGRS